MAKKSVSLKEIRNSVQNLTEDSLFAGISELPQALVQLESKFKELNNLAEDLSHKFYTGIEAVSEFTGKVILLFLPVG